MAAPRAPGAHPLPLQGERASHAVRLVPKSTRVRPKTKREREPAASRQETRALTAPEVAALIPGPTWVLTLLHGESRTAARKARAPARFLTQKPPPGERTDVPRGPPGHGPAGLSGGSPNSLPRATASPLLRTAHAVFPETPGATQHVSSLSSSRSFSTGRARAHLSVPSRSKPYLRAFATASPATGQPGSRGRAPNGATS